MPSLYPVDLPTLEQVMECYPLTVLPDTLLVDVIALMNPVSSSIVDSASDFSSCVLVVEEKNLVGIFTLRDVVRLTGAGVDLSRLKISEVMTQPVISLTRAAAQNALTALAFMRQHHIRHLPVVDEQGQLLGLITQDRIRQVIQPAHLLKLRCVTEVMVTEIIHALPTTSVLELSQMMSDRQQAEANLQNSEQQLQLALSASNTGIWDWNLQTNEVVWSESMCSLFDLDPQTFNNRFESFLNFIHPEDREFVEQSLMQSIDQHTICNIEFRVVWLDGTVHWASGKGNVFYDEGGKPLRMIGVHQDITERKQAEENIRESEQRLQAILDNSPSVIYVKDMQGRHILVNSEFERITHVTREQVKNQTDYDLFSPNIAQALTRNDQTVLTSGKPLLSEEIVEFYDKLHTFLSVKFPLCASDGQPYAICGIATDITEHKQSQAALQASEQKLQAIINNCAVAIYMIDPQNRHLLANRWYAALLSTTPENMLGKSIYEFWPAEIADRFAAYNQHVLKTKQLIQVEEVVTQADGLHTYITVKFPLCDANGEPYAVGGISTDITEQKQLEFNLKQSEAKLRDILNSSAISIARFRLFANLDWEYDYQSAGCEGIFGYTPQEMMGKYYWRSRVFPEDLENIFMPALENLLAETTVTVQYRFYHKNGSVRWISGTFTSRYDEVANCWMVTVADTDITERKQAQEKIQEQAALINIASDAIFVHDLENRILFWSQGAEKLYGWTAEESVGKLAHELFNRESLSQLEAALKNTIEQGYWQGELEQTSKNGKEIMVASRWTLINNQFGHSQSILVVNTDITEKKQLEQQFYRAQRLESIGTLASGIAHDLNNVFAPIVMIAQLLPARCKSVDARTQELFKTLATSSKRGADLVKQILTFARGTEGQRILLQPGHLLKELVKVIKQTFPKSIDIRADIPTNTLWMVKADPTQIEQVFMNLAVNARDAMPNGGMLKITAENRMIDTTYARMHLDAHAGDYIVVTVSDTGTGIPPEFLERIFDPFFTTKEIGKGTGLGLSTVLGIVKNHEGFINVLSEVGKGTQFEVFLLRGEGTATEAEMEAELPKGNGELILVVDDEAVVQQTTQETLEDYNYKTLVANDGIEAIALYAQYQDEISLVLQDMLMPNMDGFTSIRTLKALNPQVKIIATSGLPANEQKAISAGADKFLSKPYTTTDLLTTLSDVIGIKE